MIRNIKQFLFIAGLLIVAAGAQPVGAAIWQWSTTASTNATADPSINWAEGMAPSSVNDSARAMMAVLAAWRSDISGANTTTGTSTAYALATLEGVNTTPSNGQMLSFIAHATNGVSPTLQVDGGNTYPLWFNGSVAPTGALVAGTPYRVSFSVSNSAWLLEAGYGNPYAVPLGGLLPSTLATPPNSSFILPAGQCISTTTYAAYWVALGSPASGGCPGGQFAVVDMRGRVPAALDNLNGTGANRLTSAATGCGTAMTSMGAVCVNGLEGFSLTLAQLPTGITSTGTLTASVNTVNWVASNSNDSTPQTNQAGGGPGYSITNGGGGSIVSKLSSTGTATGTMTSNNTSGTAHPAVQPTIAVYYFLRVL